jgi:hypothetical protein
VAFLGRVIDGAIQIPPWVSLPEGTSVRVEPLIEEPLTRRLGSVIGTVEGLPADFSVQHNHYLHGTSKN